LEEGDASPWVDDVRTPETETLAGLSDEAMRAAIAVVAGRPWGAVQSERHAHPLGEVPLLQRIFGFTLGPDPAPGGSNTVRPDDYRLWTTLDSSSWTPPWTGEYGPSERFVARVRRKGIEGEFLIPTGQSGSPFSPHYRDLYDRWRRSGPLVPIPLDRATARARSVTEVVLEPRREDVGPVTGGRATGGVRE
jgi:penicillin amidase